MEVKVTQIGNSVGIILPKEILAKLRVEKGDRLFLTEQPGGFGIRSYDEDFAGQMAIAEDVMREYRDVLKKLAE
jgi:putative addiction module antidote